MRIEDVFCYQQPTVIMEAPYGAFQKMKDTVSSKAGGLVGGGQEAAGNKESGELANQLYKEFKKYVGQVAGRGQKFIEAKHLIDFLGNKNMNADIGKQPDEMISPKDAQTMIMNSTRQSKQVKPKAQPQQQTNQSKPAATGSEGKAKVDNSAVEMLQGLSDTDRQKLIQYLSK